MKHLCLILFCIPTLIFSQSQIVNGININGPEGFIKNGDLEWIEGDDIIQIKYTPGNSIPFKEYEELCKEGTRGTEFIRYDNFEISGNEYPLCLQEGVNGMLVLGTMVNKDGYLYIITIGVNPLQYEKSDRYEKSRDRIYFISGYMINRILDF